MTTLETKLREATGPSRELDGLIWAEVLPAIEPLIPHWSREQRESLFPPYTSSVDAALTLIPEGLTWGAQNNPPAASIFDKKGNAILLWENIEIAGKHVTAATPALAICLAAILARKGE